MRVRAFRTLCATLALLLALPLAHADEDDADADPDPPAPSFRADIAPILLDRCQSCHGPDSAEAGYRLDTFDRLMTAPGSLPPITPGDPDDSELYILLTLDGPFADDRMPKDADPLPDEQIDLIRRWIEAGAVYDGPSPDAPLSEIVPARRHPDPPATYPHPPPVRALAFSPDGAELAVNGHHEVTIWSTEDGSLLRRITNVASDTFAIAYSPCGNTLAVGGGTTGSFGEVRTFNPATGELIDVLTQTDDVILALAFSPDGSALAAAGADNAIHIHDMPAGGRRARITDHSGWVAAVAFSPDGELLASASRDRTARVFDARTGDLKITYRGHGEQVFAVAFTPDGQHIITAGADGRADLWNPGDAERVARIEGLGPAVLRLLVHDDILLTASADGHARHHHLPDRQLTRAFSPHNDWLYALAFHPDPPRLATGSHDGQIRIQPLDDDEPTLTFHPVPGE